MLTPRDDLAPPARFQVYKPSGAFLPRLMSPSRLAGRDPGFDKITFERLPKPSGVLSYALTHSGDSVPCVPIASRETLVNLKLALLKNWARMSQVDDVLIAKLSIYLSSKVRHIIDPVNELSPLTSDLRERLHQQGLSPFLFNHALGSENHLRLALMQLEARCIVRHGVRAFVVPVVSNIAAIDRCCTRNRLGATQEEFGAQVYLDSGRIRALTAFRALEELGDRALLADASGKVRQLVGVARDLTLRWQELHDAFQGKFTSEMARRESGAISLRVLLSEFSEILGSVPQIHEAARMLPVYSYLAGRLDRQVLFAEEVQQAGLLQRDIDRLLEDPYLVALAPGGLKAAALHEAQRMSIISAGGGGTAYADTVEAIALLAPCQSRGLQAQLHLAVICCHARIGHEASRQALVALGGESGAPVTWEKDDLAHFYKTHRGDANGLADRAYAASRGLAAKIGLLQRELIKL